MHRYDSGMCWQFLFFLFAIRRAGTETLDALIVFTGGESAVP
jgi:hypothetical protein